MSRRTTAQQPDLHGTRLKSGVIESAIQKYQRAEDGRTIILASCIHMAEPDHYTQLREIVDGAMADGFEIHYEGSRRATPQSTNLSDTERQAIADSSAALDLQFVDAPGQFGLNWVYQFSSAMNPHPQWHCIDVPHDQIIRILGPSRAHILTPEAKQLQPHLDVKPGSPIWSMHRARFIKTYINASRATGQRPSLLSRLIAKARRPAPAQPWIHHAIYPFREFTAALAALDAERNVMMLWHGAHFPGIGGMLLRNGFELMDVRWLTAVHARAALWDQGAAEAALRWRAETTAEQSNGQPAEGGAG